MRPLPGILIGLILHAAPAAAQDAAATFADLRDRLDTGQRVVLTESSGASAEGTLLGLSDSELALRIDGEQRRYREDAVTSIRPIDSPANGLLLGAAATLGVMLPWCAQQRFEQKTFCLSVIAPTFGALGAGVGWWIDEQYHPDEVYRRPATARGLRVRPRVSPSGAALVLSVGF